MRDTSHGILAEGFLDAAPARLARDVDDGRQRLMRAAGARLGSGRRIDALDEIDVEGRGEADRLRIAGALARGKPVQALLVKNHRDAEARRLDEEPLDVVGQLRHAARGEPIARVARPRHVTGRMAVGKRGACLCRVEPPRPVDQRVGPLSPEAHHLPDFFFEGHPRQQILDALVHRQVRIPVLGGRTLAIRHDVGFVSLFHRLPFKTSPTASNAGLGRPSRSHSSG